MQRNLLPKKSKKEIIKILQGRKLENLQAIQNIENFFMKKRGYIFKMPKPKTSVILLLSGGLDSTINWALLMDIYHLTVYPLVRMSPETGNESRKAKRVLKVFSEIFKKKYPDFFREPLFYKEDFFVAEIQKKYLKQLSRNKKRVLKFITSNNDLLTEIPDFMSLYISTALQYRDLLALKKNDKINTLFFGLVSTDGEETKAQTFTSLRSMMFNACNTTQDYNLQISALSIEKELGYFLSAKELIQSNQYLKLPLEKTWSCQKTRGLYHCGSCPNCSTRRFKFSSAGVEDKTIYLSDYRSSILFYYYKKWFQPHFPLLHDIIKYWYNSFRERR